MRWCWPLLLLVGACRFDLDAVSRPREDLRVVQVRDGAGAHSPDLHARDAATDRRRDTARPDARATGERPPDRPLPDRPLPDRPPPDRPPPEKAPAKTCWELYHLAPGYELCEEKPKSCRFYVFTGGTTCTTVCASFGGTCRGAQNNGNGKCIVGPPPIGCDTSYADQICECSKP